MKSNTPELWDNFWQESPSTQEDIYLLAKEAHSIRWQRIHARITAHFPSFEGLRVIEIGAGAGTYAALMARLGAQVTLLDYSNKALERAQEFFERLNLNAEYVNANAFDLPNNLNGAFDISMSFGLNEHFSGPQRLQITRAHLDVLRPGGMTFISVPNRYNPPYRMFKFVAQHTDKWVFGEEYPYSYWELRSLCQQLDCTHCQILGDSLWNSLDFINPVKGSAYVRRLLRISDDFDVTRLRDQRGTWLDAYFSYALVWSAKKH